MSEREKDVCVYMCCMNQWVRVREKVTVFKRGRERNIVRGGDVEGQKIKIMCVRMDNK